jgi:hypothetical protein
MAIPWGVGVGALPHFGMRWLHTTVDIHKVDVCMSCWGQHGLVREIEKRATGSGAHKVYLSKCFYRSLRQTYGFDGILVREQHYCYAVFV